MRESCDMPATRVTSPADIYRLLLPKVAGEMQESFYCIVLDTQSNVRHALEITRGTLNSSLVHPREVFRPAIVAGAAGIILAHNHPSGETTPSPDDRAITRQLVEAGRVLDIPVYDHVIIGAPFAGQEGRYLSFSEAGLL